MIKKILLIIISTFITINTNAIFKDYFRFEHKVNTQALRNKKLGYSNKLNIYNSSLENLFDILNKKIILSPSQINTIIIILNHMLKKQEQDALKKNGSFLEKNDEKNLGLNSFDINQLFIVPSLGINPNYLANFLDHIATANIMNKNLRIKKEYKFVFIENFFEYIKNNNLQTFAAIAILKILNPKNIFIVQKKLNNEITSNKIDKTDLSYFMKYKKLYKKIENKKMDIHNPQIIKMEIQNFYTYKCIYLNEEERTRFIITKNLNKTIKQMVNVLTFLSNKIDFHISYNKKAFPKNISLNKKIDDLLKIKNLIKKNSKFKNCPTKITKINKSFIYKISPITLKLIKKNILCIYKIKSNLEIKKIRI